MSERGLGSLDCRAAASKPANERKREIKLNGKLTPLADLEKLDEHLSLAQLRLQASVFCLRRGKFTVKRGAQVARPPRAACGRAHAAKPAAESNGSEHFPLAG